VRLNRTAAAPHLIWNAFVDLLASASHDELTAVQRVAYLAFHYDAEVTSGGHARFLQHAGAARLDETVSALATLGAVAQGDVLRRAGHAASTELARLDDEFHRCRPEIHVLLQGWLERHQEQFIVVEG
jgi:hypothetical protein